MAVRRARGYGGTGGTGGTGGWQGSFCTVIPGRASSREPGTQAAVRAARPTGFLADRAPHVRCVVKPGAGLQGQRTLSGALHDLFLAGIERKDRVFHYLK
jgi:hypothetical protein